jgi:hypothetical protein
MPGCNRVDLGIPMRRIRRLVAIPTGKVGRPLWVAGMTIATYCRRVEASLNGASARACERADTPAGEIWRG